MWRAYNKFGFLEYNFSETVDALFPFYVIRAIGGLLYLTGALLMAYNVWRTIRGDQPVDVEDQPGVAATPTGPLRGPLVPAATPAE